MGSENSANQHLIDGANVAALDTADQLRVWLELLAHTQVRGTLNVFSLPGIRRMHGTFAEDLRTWLMDTQKSFINKIMSISYLLYIQSNHTFIFVLALGCICR